MMSFLKKYRAPGISFVLVFGTIFFLQVFNLVLIDSSEMLENIAIFVFWWLLLTFIIWKFPFLKRNRLFTLKIIGLISIWILAIVVDTYANIPDNPLTIGLLTLFWLGVAFLVFPKFIKRYGVFLFAAYGLIMLYFVLVRWSPSYFQDYKSTVLYLLISPIPIFLFLLVFEQWKWFRNLKSEKSKAELQLLKNQINPHFFFNTLNNLYGLTVEKSDKAPETVLKLSEMMRYTIYEAKEDVVSLQQEIDYLNNYIDLQKIRFQKKLQISFIREMDAEYEIAPLLFINLVENAFKHGVEPSLGASFINIELKVNKGMLFFKIENQYESEEEKSPNGIGLENLKNRLELIYPKNHVLQIKKINEIYSVTLEIQLH